VTKGKPTDTITRSSHLLSFNYTKLFYRILGPPALLQFNLGPVIDRPILQLDFFWCYRPMGV